MSRYYSNYTTCIHCDDLTAVEQAIIHLLKQEGGCHFSLSQLPDSLEQITKNNAWIVGLFAGKGGWTIVKTWSVELLCHPTADGSRPLLSTLARELECDAFHLSVYSGTNGICGILLEANAAGHVYVSGAFNADVPNNSFYQQPIDGPDLIEQFSLLKVPESFQVAMRINKDPEIIREEAEYERISSQKNPDWELLNELREEVSKGYTERIDLALEAILDSSGAWPYPNIAYAIYVYPNELAATKGHLLYFQPSSNYERPPAYILTPNQWLELFGDIPPVDD